MVYRPTRVGNVRSCVANAWSQFFGFDFRTPGRPCKDIGPAIADQCLDGWHCQRLFWYSGSLPELITQ